MAKYGQSKITFINPYNFVGIGTPERSEDREKQIQEPSLHTGYLDCSLYLRTPLSIPDTARKKEDDQEKEHDVYPFMRLGEKGSAFIPGSALRGVVRSAYEAITDSCMSTIVQGEGISTRVKHTDAYQPCILAVVEEDGKAQYRLYEAKRYALVCADEDHKAFNNRDVRHTKFEGGTDTKRGTRYVLDSDGAEVLWGDRVMFEEGDEYLNRNGFPVWDATVLKMHKCQDNQQQELRKNGQLEGIACIGEPIDNKHAESVFVKGNEVTGFSEEELRQAYAGLMETFAEYGDSAVNRNLGDGHLGYRSVKCRITSGKVTELPIWRSKKELYFSLASIGRKQYRKTMETLAGKPCTDRSCCCRACALFGLVSGEKAGTVKSAASMVRFSDAFPADGTDATLSFQTVTLQELGKPRTSYLPFYAKGGIPFDAPDSGIRGRKFYWHNPAAATNADVYQTKEKTNRNATHELLMPGAQFRFRVYFDNIRKEQLEELMFILTLGENDVDGAHCHKFGHGKPLGLGSCKVVINECAERFWSAQDAAYRMERKTGDALLLTMPKKTRALEELLTITDYNVMKNVSVSYPPEITLDLTKPKLKQIYDVQTSSGIVLKENVLARHQWFSNNKAVLPELIKKDSGALKGMELTEFTGRNGIYNDFERPRGQGRKVNQNHYNRQNQSNQRNQDQKNGSAAQKPAKENTVSGQEADGVFKRFFKDKGFGFVSIGKDKDVFVHYTAIESYQQGMDYAGKKVHVVYQEDKKGLSAVQCEIIQ